MPSTDADELLPTLQNVVEMQDKLLRRQLATERAYERIESEQQRTGAVAAQVVDNTSEIKLLRYQNAQQDEQLKIYATQFELVFAAQRSQASRLLVFSITTLILIAVLGLPLAILLTR